MGFIEDANIGWFPLETMALKDDLPSFEQLRLERESPENAPPRKTLAIVARYPLNEKNWPFTFKGCHPAKRWRRPTDAELTQARKFYGK